MTELKPCPGCGSDKLRRVKGMQTAFVVCDDCDKIGPQSPPVVPSGLADWDTAQWMGDQYWNAIPREESEG
jgi:hypothetical protein